MSRVFSRMFLIVTVLFVCVGMSEACQESSHPAIVSCNGCESAQDVASEFEQNWPSSEYLNISFTLSQARFTIYDRVLGVWVPVAENLPFDKSCGETWLAALNDSNVDWDLIDTLVSGSTGDGDSGSGGGGGYSGPIGGGPGGGGVPGGDCYYSNGYPLPGNPSYCPPTNFPDEEQY